MNLLPNLFARSAPLLNAMEIGNKSHGCVMRVQSFLEVERDEHGDVIEVKNARW